jgi:hypothetical protein
MSGVVNFSDGSFWSVGRRGWNLLVERTRRRLENQGLGHLGAEITDYGAFFNRDPDEVRKPLAKALRDSALELERECSELEGWDTRVQGPYFGDLVDKLETELRLERPGGD